MILAVLAFYFFTWVLVVILGGMMNGIQTALPQLTGLTLPQWAPGVAALVVATVFESQGIRINFSLKEIKTRQWLAALVIPLGVGLVAYLLGFLLPGGVSLEGLLPKLTLPLLLWMPIGAIGEEVGWRGYLNKRLDNGLPGWVAAVLTGVLWTIFHVQFLGYGMVFLLFTLLLFISISIVMQAVVKKLDYNIWVAAVFHLGINLTSLVFLNVISTLPFMMLYSLVWAAVAVFTLVRYREPFRS